MDPAFHAFDLAHTSVIVATFALSLGSSSIFLKTRSTGFDAFFRFLLAFTLGINFVSFAVRGCVSGTINWKQALPFQLCDWTTIGVIVACVLGSGARLFEVLYFWGIGGSLQAVLTPNLSFGFPDYRFICFFIDHCGIVIGVVYLMLTRRFRPTLASVWRTWLWSLAYLHITLVVDEVTGVNYGFLLHKPEAFSILSYLSDSRSMYLFQLNLLALFFFAVLYAPFAVNDVFRSKPVFSP
jgi:hypothetical integral membrane protein (TIGR02206 family)